MGNRALENRVYRARALTEVTKTAIHDARYLCSDLESIQHWNQELDIEDGKTQDLLDQARHLLIALVDDLRQREHLLEQARLDKGMAHD